MLPDQAEAARLYMRLLMSSLSVTVPADAYAGMREQAERLPADETGLAAERLRGWVMGHRDWLFADVARARLRQQCRDLSARRMPRIADGGVRPRSERRSMATFD